MGKYRKKKMTIAMKWGGLLNNDESLKKIRQFIGEGNFRLDFSKDERGEIILERFNSERVAVGDYVIKGANGFYSCDSEFFEKIYEEVK